MITTYTHSTCSTARLFFLKSLFSEGEKHIIITDNDRDIFLLKNFGKVILKKEVIFVEQISHLWNMLERDSGIFCIQSNLLEIGGKKEYLKRNSSHEINRGENTSPEEFIEKLIQSGYIHSSYLGELGTYRREGSIISYIDHLTGNICHIEWFDTEIDSIIEIEQPYEKRVFRDTIILKNKNPESFERIEGIPNSEILDILSEFGKITLIGCDFLSYIEQLRSIARVHFSDFPRENSLSLDVSIPDIPHIEVLKEIISKNPSTRIYTRHEKTIHEFLEYNQLQNIEVIPMRKLGLESFEFSLGNSNTEFPNYLIITDDILGEIFVQNRTRKSVAKNLDLLLSLKPGDYVVHREHGIARFHNIVQKTIGNLEREYLELHYAGEDKLFVPLTEIYRVSKYLGNLEPTLTSLAGKEWERTIEKADEEIALIAEEILETSAKRSLAKGRSFGIYREEEEHFQGTFQYDYTRDQLSAIEDIFADMEAPTPMDRLISGDVGFGKTEVAMNAIYKAVLSGTQVAVISPLLVLADEHYETFTERLGVFGIRIGVMTRMNSEREQKQTIEALKNGTIDVVVGTHRLLSEDIRFARLGLLVIDEEHKFGVSHKEKLKKLRAGLDILSLSATPIPRSLNLALSGLKKISILATPPKKRKPIETIITRWNERIIQQAIESEMTRGGQIIIVHNRIRGMESIEKEIAMIIGNDEKNESQARIIITHGQMPGEQIEDRIHAFKKGEYDILLTTTIIENGVNFLSANTIIILDPEDFGLAQLHQLRGRVGRKDVQGYCYLIYRKAELVKEEKERLITIANNTHLGAGFEIAMRDLEIRGAGDVLGFKQSGKSKDVGLTLYFRMLEEKIEELKNEKKKKVWTKIELDISYIIPDNCFLSETDKLNFYREIENIENIEELEEIEQGFHQELERKEKQSTANLFLLLRARILFSEYGVLKLSKLGVNYVFDFSDGTDVNQVKTFLEHFDSKRRMVLVSLKKIRVETRNWKNIEEFLEELVR